MLYSFTVVPGYTFFYWGFTIPRKYYSSFHKHFHFSKGRQTKEISLKIENKVFPAKIREVHITSKKFPHRKVVQIYYGTNYQTLKALRKLFIYSYATTINKKKPQLKETFELVHEGGSRFRVKVLARQQTDFDRMFYFLEDKNLFEYWKERKKEEDSFFIDFARRWLSVDKLEEYKNRSNVIYLLYNSKKKQLYVGKANKFGSRVRRGRGRVGLHGGWDRFMYFEIYPKYANLIEQIEAYTIRMFSTILSNEVRFAPLREKDVKLVNRHLRRR